MVELKETIGLNATFLRKSRSILRKIIKKKNIEQKIELVYTFFSEKISTPFTSKSKIRLITSGQNISSINAECTMILKFLKPSQVQ